MSHSILAANLWPVFNFADPNERYQRFLRRGRPALKQLIDSLILYDHVVIPTQEPLILSVLLGVLGESAVRELVGAGAVRFLRMRGALAYVGNGGGLCAYTVDHKDGSASAFGADLDVAVSWATRGLIGEFDHRAILEDVVAVTNEIDISVLLESVRNNTHRDLTSSAALREYYDLTSTSFDRLPGIGPAGVRIYGGVDAVPGPAEPTKDAIARLLTLAHVNLELQAAEAAGTNDASTAAPIEMVLAAKLERHMAAKPEPELLTLRALADLPDVGEAALAGATTIEQIVRLRASRDAEEFRSWFHANCRDDAIATGRAYANLLRAVPRVATMPVRVARFLVTTGLGLLAGPVGAIVGGVAGAVDSFVLERIMRGRSPKYFLEEWRQMESPGQ